MSIKKLPNYCNINRGVEIRINNKLLKGQSLQLIKNEHISPAYKEVKSGKVTVQIYSGVGTDKLEEGGWYIFCNDRLVVGPEQSYVTGWTGKGKDGVAVYHEQFNRFRGYVFFNSDDSSALPWTTTKTTMDLDSPLFVWVRQIMIEMMKPVITYLNKLKLEKEKDNPESNQPLNNIARSSSEVSIANIKETELPQTFQFTNFTFKKESSTESKIAYTVSAKKLDAAKKFFNVNSNKEVGEKTFDYFYKSEIV